MSNYSVKKIKIDDFYEGTYSTVNSITGNYNQDLSVSNSYIYNLSGNTTFTAATASPSVYNFVVNAGANTFSLGTASGITFATPDGSALGLTGSFVMSGLYDGSKMWITWVDGYSDLL